VGSIAEAMRARGFNDRELDLMFKENPAKVLGLKAMP
jgi:predicted metal-dependent phosphotriesterase family hydrolase